MNVSEELIREIVQKVLAEVQQSRERRGFCKRKRSKRYYQDRDRDCQMRAL